ncbi:alanyl-tRNA editing protein, partial [Candidatus Woesearchaeota archaeon CG_4_10_14_0_8_um_filter_47_5]
MTQKLFWQDPYQTECTARVTSLENTGETIKVKLDQTIFFAFSGGQESDNGTIGEVPVVNAVKHG